MRNGWNLYAYNAGIRLGTRGDSSLLYRYYYDVDGFRVSRGCWAKGRWGHGGLFSFNRQGYSTSLWVRLTGKDEASIHSYTC